MRFNENQIFEAHISFGSPSFEGERETRIQYLAARPEHDAHRWWLNRHGAWPEHFSELYAIKLYMITPQHIDEAGFLEPGNGFHIFEWKCDWGAPIEQYIAAAEAKRAKASAA